MITEKRIDTIDGIKDLIFEQTYNSSIDRIAPFVTLFTLS